MSRLTEQREKVDVDGVVKILRILADMIEEGSAELVSFLSHSITDNRNGGVWVEVRFPKVGRGEQ